MRTSFSHPEPSASPRWWHNDIVLRHVNKLVCGEGVGGITGGDAQKLASFGPFKRAVSVGCGNGFKELALLKRGLVEHFTLCEDSRDARKLAKESANSQGLSRRVSFSEVDFKAGKASYDLVYWNHSLHRIHDVAEAIAWSARALRVGGVFYLNGYVGANRLQHSDVYLELANRYRSVLPARIIHGQPRIVQRVDIEMLKRSDPSLAVDSERILPTIREVFKEVQLKPLGGVIYSCALHGVLSNFDPDDQSLLGAGLVLDELAARRGLSESALVISKV